GRPTATVGWAAVAARRGSHELRASRASAEPLAAPLLQIGDGVDVGQLAVPGRDLDDGTELSEQRREAELAGGEESLGRDERGLARVSGAQRLPTTALVDRHDDVARRVDEAIEDAADGRQVAGQHDDVIGGEL